VVTDDIVGFAKEGDDMMIDSIPLNEVETVQEMSKFKTSVDKAKFSNAFMITTIPEGSNDGRTYYLQADSEDQCSELATRIAGMGRRAARRAETKSRIHKIQYLARSIYASEQFQFGCALLILAVGPLCDCAPPSQFDLSRPAPQNFATSIMDAEIASELVDERGELTDLGRMDAALNLFFTIAFTCELAFNAFANWFAALANRSRRPYACIRAGAGASQARP
jgi:hypothetical protein